MDGTILRGVVASIVAFSCVACSGAQSLVLVEGVNGKVATTPVSVRQVAAREEWRSGKRVTIRYATLLVHESKAKEIERHFVAEGDGLIIGGVEYTVVAVERGNPSARATVTLQKKED